MDTLNAESTALVVGASGGIGHAFVRRLLAESRVRRVWAATRSPRSPDLMALGEAYGDRLAPVVVDILDEQSIADLARHIGGRDPRLHLLINAFGFLHDREADIWPEKRLEDITPEAMLRNYRVNTLAPALIARHFLPLLNHRERAVFASLSARVGSIGDNRLGGWYSYRTSKAAQNMFTRGLAIECGRRAKRVICLALHHRHRPVRAVPGTCAGGQAVQPGLCRRQTPRAHRRRQRGRFGRIFRLGRRADSLVSPAGSGGTGLCRQCLGNHTA